MATTFMHLYVAQALAEQLAVSDRSQYYLGSIAPDSVNVDGFAEKAVRWKAHLRHKDFVQWYQNVSAFYRANRDTFPDRNLLLGYAVHILTDLAWDGYYFNRIRPHMQSLEHPPIPDWDACIQDSFRYDSGQIHAEWWEKRVKRQLRQAVPQPIGSVSAEVLGRYRRYVADAYEKTLQQEPALFITDTVLNELAKETGRVCAAYLTEPCASADDTA